eukprot:gene2726-2765_t
MYGVAPGAVAAWRALFEHVAARSGVGLEIIDHAFPAPLADLWSRDDLGCTFICGWPYVHRSEHLVPVAAPVMDDPLAAGRPVYWTDLVVRADDPAVSLEDLRGRTIAFTVEDSQSGFNAVRHYLRGLPGVKPVFGREFGPVFTPLRSIEAVISGDADVGPVDSTAHALLMLHAPELAEQVRIVAQTAPTPCPLLVASRSVDAAVVEALRATFLQLADDATARHLLFSLGLQGFAEPLPLAEYRRLEEDALDAVSHGITRLEA